jgi:hypothetical protein
LVRGDGDIWDEGFWDWKEGGESEVNEREMKRTES